jgi:hypothetical protein
MLQNQIVLGMKTWNHKKYLPNSQEQEEQQRPGHKHQEVVHQEEKQEEQVKQEPEHEDQ